MVCEQDIVAHIQDVAILIYTRYPYLVSILKSCEKTIGLSLGVNLSALPEVGRYCRNIEPFRLGQGALSNLFSAGEKSCNKRAEQN